VTIALFFSLVKDKKDMYHYSDFETFLALLAARDKKIIGY
jgi:hypothetical protein